MPYLDHVMFTQQKLPAGARSVDQPFERTELRHDHLRRGM
jgi:hypothetical protein